MGDTLQKITPDFLWSQIRTLCVGVIAYLAGRHTFTPEDAGLATVILTTMGPVLIPWAWGFFSNFGTVKVNSSSVAAAVAKVETVTDDKAALKNAVDVAPQKG